MSINGAKTPARSNKWIYFQASRHFSAPAYSSSSIALARYMSRGDVRSMTLRYSDGSSNLIIVYLDESDQRKTNAFLIFSYYICLTLIHWMIFHIWICFFYRLLLPVGKIWNLCCSWKLNFFNYFVYYWIFNKNCLWFCRWYGQRQSGCTARHARRSGLSNSSLRGDTHGVRHAKEKQAESWPGKAEEPWSLSQLAADTFHACNPAR